MRSLRAALTLLLLGTPALAERPDWDDTPRIAIVSAFEPEWLALKEVVQPTGHSIQHGTEFVTGTLEGKDVVLYLSGVSMVNAAMTAQLALDRFNIQAIAFTGIAGSAEPKYDIGDVAIPLRWGQYFEVVAGRERDGAFTMPRFFRSDHKNFGMFFTRPLDVITAQSQKPETKFWFEVDPKLFRIAAEAAKDVKLSNCSKGNACLTKMPEVRIGGNGVSGSVFVDNAQLRNWAHETFKADVLDMESAAVAQVAYSNDVPFIAFRSVSDLAGGGAGHNEMGTFMDLAAANSVAVMSRFVAALPPVSEIRGLE
ncbi:5'-methylthioadenosine/S-adenosylhomocysteine nucleosidase [Paracoccus aminophilus]|uniref:S-adenosylhomocysteine/5'-methylthioadenosine nucleosidase n=1 Tax=Paracoccus aminophilus JCM 7686 TaxID=1367847 RepID=S5Y9N2_PARAH|nr:5'-methylthioadenosine/S-adenosylhomocysteine nucleosidase [Paracoccus aminophilus]AGT08043.1 S-adenosylhomocysteine/5'-methylthioadenosine nucleosidase [Paracoccus aminophilus JCM 7686]